MTESEKPKKLTLSLNKTDNNEDKTTERKRTGARAHQAAQRQRQQWQQKNTEKRHQDLRRKQEQAQNRQKQLTKPRDTVHSNAKSVGLRDDSQVFNVFAPCPNGLEPALFNELQALGFDDVKQGHAGCSFKANWLEVMQANLHCRIATRILIQLAHAPVQTENEILELAQNTQWEQWFGPEHTLRVDTSARRSPMQSLQYCNLRAKDGICDRLRELENARPSIDTVRPNARVHLFLDETSATLYLDTTGESLFKRGWRFDKGSAPIRENLAAGILALSPWDINAPLLDPFCGSGTILIEAAWQALNIAPGLYRPFAFQRLRDHNDTQWQELRQQARDAIKPTLDTPIFGFDTDANVLRAAMDNIKRALPIQHINAAAVNKNLIHLEQKNAVTAIAPAQNGYIVTNPPYGERMQSDNDLYLDWAANLKRNYAGWQAHIISSDLELPSKMRLKPRRRQPLFNGALDCRLFSFDVVAQQYRR